MAYIVIYRYELDFHLLTIKEALEILASGAEMTVDGDTQQIEIRIIKRH